MGNVLSKERPLANPLTKASEPWSGIGPFVEQTRSHASHGCLSAPIVFHDSDRSYDGTGKFPPWGCANYPVALAMDCAHGKLPWRTLAGPVTEAVAAALVTFVRENRVQDCFDTHGTLHKDGYIMSERLFKQRRWTERPYTSRRLVQIYAIDQSAAASQTSMAVV